MVALNCKFEPIPMVGEVGLILTVDGVGPGVTLADVAPPPQDARETDNNAVRRSDPITFKRPSAG